MIGVNTSIFKSAGRKLVNLLGALKDRAAYYENGTDSVAEKNRIDDLGVLDKATILLTPTATSDARVHSVKTYTGDELVTDGSFENGLSDWDSDSNVTIVNGAARFNNIGLSGANAYLIENSILEAGKTYKFECDVISTNGKDLVLERANPSNTSISATTTGHKIIYFTQDTQPHLTIKRIDAETDVTIDNISVTEADADFDFDRASSATRINSDGLVQDMQSITDPELVLNGDFEELGDEEVTNGTFDTDSGWSFYNADADTNTRFENNSAVLEVINSQFTRFISTTSPMTVGKFYKITYEVTDTDNTDLNIQYPSTALNSSIGTHTVYIKATNVNIGFSKSNVGKIIIDNISVQQVDPNDRWTLGTSWSIENGVASSDGTQVGNSSLSQSSVLPSASGKTYKITFTISNYVSGSVQVYPTNTTVGTYPKENANGTYTKYVKVTSATPNDILYIQANADFVGSVDNISVKDITFSTDVDLARINYDSNGENGHILLEPTSTNLITYSEDFSDSSWNLDFAASFITRTPNAATSPSGKNNATKLIGNDTSRDPSNSYIGASTSASAPYSASIFAKKGEYDYLVLGIGGYNEGFYAIFNLSNGTVSTSPTASGTTASIEDYDNGWFRCIITTTSTLGTEILFTTPSVDGTLTTDYTSTTNGVYVWGAQLEELSYATSYIPNHGTALGVTRAVEKLTGSGNSTLINSREGVLYAEIAKVQDNPDHYRLISLNNAASNSHDTSVTLGFDNSDDDFYIRIRSGGVDKLLSYDQSATANAFHKVAIRYKSGDSAFFINGTKLTSYNTGDGTATFTFPVDLDNLSFDYNGNGTLPFYGKCKALAVFNEALEDDELELLTGVTNYGSFSELASANGYTII